MYKIFSVLLLIFCLSFISFTPVFAQTDLLLGQNDYYSVILRGNGEAIVYAKLVINNSDDTSITHYSFTIPKVSPYEMVVFQQKLPPVCQQYNYQSSGNSCIKYIEPDYNNNYGGYGQGTTQYQRIHPTQSGNTYSFDLPFSIDAYKSGALIVSYAAKGYTKESFGLFSFSFPTIQVPDRISSVQVSADVDSDLYLKGNQSKVNYQSTGVALPQMGISSSNISNPALDEVVGQIGSYGGLIKQAKGLAPNESFVVNGEYATNWWRLYLNEILLTVGVIIGLSIVTYIVIKFFHKKDRGFSKEQTPITHDIRGHRNWSTGDGLVDLFVGLISALLTVGLTYLLLAFSRGISTYMPMSYYSDSVLQIIFLILGLLLYAFAVFGPAIVIAMKKGWKDFIFVLIAEFVWLLIFVLIYLVLFQSGLNSHPVPYPITTPLLKM